eukprot:190249_1
MAYSLLIWAIVSTFLCSTIYGMSRTCSQQSQCIADITCTNNEACTITCTGGGCNNGIQINCPTTSHQCTVTCYGGSLGGTACKNLIIEATDSSSLYVESGGIGDSMATAQIRCPTYGICDILCAFSRSCYQADLFTAKGTNLTVKATTSNAFWDGYISCKNRAICQLTCTGYSACKGAEVNAQYSNNARIILHANGETAFENGKIYGSSGTIATVWVECQGRASCVSATFDARISASLTVTNATGYNVLQNSQIHCPDNGANKEIVCSIHVNGYGSLNNALIYAAESFRDVYLYCEDSGSPCDSATDISSLRIKCTASYANECTMRIFGYDSWGCIDTASTCQRFQYPTASPTSKPTQDPTLGTSMPTINPSVSPTTIPSVSPTGNPTMPPTRDPTFTPTPNMPLHITLKGKTPTLDPLSEGEVKEISTTPIATSVFTTPTETNDNSFVIVVCIVSGVICCAIGGIVCYGRQKIKSDAPGASGRGAAYNIDTNVRSQNPNRVDDAIGKSNYVDIELSVKQQTPRSPKTPKSPKEAEEPPHIELQNSSSNPFAKLQSKFSNSMTYHVKVRSSSVMSDEGQAPQTKPPEEETRGRLETIGGHSAQISYDEENQEHRGVKEWLEGECGFGDYLHTFISNGYESVDIIKEIEIRSELEEIGITIKGHQTKLWAEIKKLKTTTRGKTIL